MTENQEWVFNAIRFERKVHLCIKDFEGWKCRYVPLPLNEDTILESAGQWQSFFETYRNQVDGKLAQFIREYETDTIENKGIVERQLNYAIECLPVSEKWFEVITYSLKSHDKSLESRELEGDTLETVREQRKDLYCAFNAMKASIAIAKWLKFEIVDKLPATAQGDKDKKAEVLDENPKHPKTVRKEQNYYNYTDYYIKLRKCVSPNYNQNKAIEKTLENFNIGERTLGRALEANTESLDKLGLQKSVSRKYLYVKY